MNLTQEQQAAVADIMDPSYPVVFLTGQAGSGKSTIIRAVMNMGGVTVCATTGKAAMNIGGVTVDKLFGIDRAQWKIFSRGYTEYMMNRTDTVILIDEASMIGEKMSNLLYKVAGDYNKKLVLVGDWGQAAPVQDKWPFQSTLFQDIHKVKLTECHRQAQGAYLNALNKVRVGEIDGSVDAVFSSVIQPKTPDKSFPGICMFGTNASSDRYNNKCFQEHLQETGHWGTKFIANVTDVRKPDKQAERPLKPSDVSRMIEDSSMLHEEMLSIGCKVVCTRNAKSGMMSIGPYQNGTMGEIVDVIYNDGRSLSSCEKDFDDQEGTPNQVIIRAFNGRQFQMSRETLEVCDPLGNPQYLVEGFPLKMGYGITIHKAQGMTVDRAWACLSSLSYFPNGSRHGLAYVALSRTRTLDGLAIDSWSKDVVECHDIVRPWL